MRQVYKEFQIIILVVSMLFGVVTNSFGQLSFEYWMWGYNTFRPSPTHVFVNSKYKAISAGTDSETIAAIRENGTLSLGRDDNTMGTDTDWKSVATGYLYGIALKENGTLWTWGLNNYGQLGDGTYIDKSEAQQIGTDADWKTIASGYAVTLVIKNDGSLWACGLNDDGQLGIGANTPQNANILRQIGTDHDWDQISAGQKHALALKKNGTLWTWGDNEYGQLGIGSTLDKYSPQQVGTGLWRSISAGWLHTLAIKQDGSLWAWGYGRYGQIGDGSTWQNTYAPVKIGSDQDWKNISAGTVSSMAIKANGTLWGWGENKENVLGLTGIQQVSIPIQVGTETNWEFVSTSCGFYHTLALKKIPSPPYLITISSLDAVYVSYNTPFTSLNLPSSISVTYSDGSTGNVIVTWFADNYNPSSAGSYTLEGSLNSTVLNPNNLTAKIIVVVDKRHITALKSPGEFCVGNEYPQTVEVEFSDGLKENMVVIWDDFNETNPGIYSLTGTPTLDSNTDNPGNLTASLNIVVPPVFTLGSDIDSCDPSVKLTSNITNADTYSWQTPSGIIENQSELTATMSGTYVLTLTQNGCEQTDAIQVTVASITEGNFTIVTAGIHLDDEESILTDIPLSFINTTGTGTGFLWSFGDGTSSSEESPVHAYKDPGMYTIILQGHNTRNCSIIVKKVIEIKNILITSAISPNGDNKNDKLFIEPLLFEASLKVIDRDGKTVFEASPYHDDFTGKNLESGVYYYELYFREIDRHYKGAIHVIE